MPSRPTTKQVAQALGETRVPLYPYICSDLWHMNLQFYRGTVNRRYKYFYVILQSI